VLRPVSVRVPMKQHAHSLVKRYRAIDVRRSNHEQIYDWR
jgi:hypothetical protein